MRILSASIAALIATSSLTSSFITSTPFRRGVACINPSFSSLHQQQEDDDSITVSSPSSPRDAEILPSTPSNIIHSPYVPPQGEAYKHGFFLDEPKLITIDAVNTVIQLRSDVGMFYREVLFEATDYNVRLPRPDLFSEAFHKAYKEMDEKYPCFGCGKGMTSKEWWRDVVYKTYDNVDLQDPVLREEMDEWLLEEVFEALYSDVFVTEEAWELRPGALEALSHLVTWRKEGGPVLAVLSNMDERLHSVLKNLDILDAFDFVLTSREIGAAKPDRRAFEVAMSRRGLTKPEECMHVGDNFQKDVVGASEAGWHAVYIPATGEQEIPPGTKEDLVFSMVGDLFGILHMYGKEPEKRIVVTTRPILEGGNFAFHQKVWSDREDEEMEPKTPYSLPSKEQKSWEGPGRF